MSHRSLSLVNRQACVDISGVVNNFAAPNVTRVNAHPDHHIGKVPGCQSKKNKEEFEFARTSSA